jgi:membrane-associated phospholipid phosphatase
MSLLFVSIATVCLPTAVAAAAAPPDADVDNAPPPVPVAGAGSGERTKSIEPKASEIPPPGPLKLSVDPVADGGIIIGAAAFAGILDLINSTGEVRPQQISPNFDKSSLLGIDRHAVNQTPDGGARMRSNIAFFAALSFAAIDPVLTGIREKNVQSAIVDAFIYGEALAITWGVTNLAKIAVRRPRPQAYIDAEAHKGEPNYSNADTDSSLSFFSGHAAGTAAVSATATYLAFVRSPHTARPWITLGVGTALTAFTSVERVRAAAHFPTDVIAGAIAGAGVGVLVAHIHRNEDLKQRRIWVGAAPAPGGGNVSLGAMF